MSSTRVCFAANTLDFPQGGGHVLACLDWALGLQAIGSAGPAKLRFDVRLDAAAGVDRALSRRSV
jgi:hypothetical protein